MLFKDIIGQAVIKQRLVQSVKDNRISHAQLFFGTEGSGSLALAMAYSQYIVCEQKQENDSCGKCTPCIKIQKLVHPDIHFVYPIISSKEVEISTDIITEWRAAFLDNPYMSLFQWYEFLGAENKQGIINVKESAEILHKLSLYSYESEFKIMIIWMPEKMPPPAANKLLKILEEPTEKTLFILVSENEDQMLRTILSRAQLIKINKISTQDMSLALQERNGLSQEDALKIVNLSDGNYNTAVRLMLENENSTFNFSNFQNWMRACFKFEASKILSFIDEMAGSGREKQKNFLSYALHIIRESLMMNYASIDLTKLQGDELDFVKKFSPFINAANGERITESLNKAHYHIERNANPKILFFDLSFKINELLNMPKKS